MRHRLHNNCEPVPYTLTSEATMVSFCFANIKIDKICEMLYTVTIKGGGNVKTSFASAAGPPAKEAYSKQASERRRL